MTNFDWKIEIFWELPEKIESFRNLAGKIEIFVKLPEKIEIFRKFAWKNRNFLDPDPRPL